MSYWGMGITQSDEYCEIYERFMEEYDEGKPVADITKDILEEYLDEFEEADGVLHDVYFALGKAQWMCAELSETVHNRIRHIIESGANIAFLRELEVSEAELKIRQKKLDKFLLGLSIPGEKARKRRTPESKYVVQDKAEHPSLPKMKIGDVFAYKHNNAYRIFAIVRRERILGREAVYIYAWRNDFPDIPKITELEHEHLFPIGYFHGETFPDSKDYCRIGNMPELQKLGEIILPGVICENWKLATHAMATPVNLTEEYPLSLCLTLNEVFERIRQIRKQNTQK